MFVCIFLTTQAESRDLLKETSGGGKQVETGLYPQTQGSKSALDCDLHDDLREGHTTLAIPVKCGMQYIHHTYKSKGF